MAYLTYSEYTEAVKSPMSEADFDVFEAMAEEVVDAYTFDAVERYGLMSSDIYAKRIKKAVAYETDTIADTDGATVTEREIASRSVTVGETSESVTYVTNGQGDVTTLVNGIMLSPVARTLLTKVRAMGRIVR